MKNALTLAVAMFVAIFIAGCGSGSGTGSDAAIQVIGEVSGLNSSIAANPSNEANFSLAKATFDPDQTNARCPDTDQSNSFTTTPTAYNVLIKKFTLLGSVASGTADYDLIDVATPAAATEVDFSTNNIFLSSATLPPVGTYDGIAIEVFYIGETIPMVVPDVNAENGVSNFTIANYETRGYFYDVGNVDPRDVTILTEAFTPGTENEYWVDRDSTGSTPFDLIDVTGTHPSMVLDLWSDDNFWCENATTDCADGYRDPMTICTRATGNCDPTTQGTDFTFEITGAMTELVIPAASTATTYTITMTFDVSNGFTFWGDTNFPDVTTESFETYRVGYDCGYRIMFPNVSITLSST